MAMRRLIETAALGSALALAAMAAPAFAQDAAPMPPPPVHSAPAVIGTGPAFDQNYGMAPELRANWLAECRDRLRGSFRRREIAGRCEAYLDDYYAYYRSHQAYGPQGGTMVAYAAPAYGYASGCCQQPMMMAPVMHQPRGEPKCTETVEYEYVDVPVRARRVIPAKRVKVVPDKRIRVK